MNVGVPRERLRGEHRVGLTRFGVLQLTGLGHQVFVEHDAGVDCHWSDEDYSGGGGRIVFSTDEVYQRSDLVCRVGVLSAGDVDALRPEGAVCGFLHLAVVPRELLRRLMDKAMTLIGYEILEHEGNRPILMALSDIAGQLAVHTAANLLQHPSGGRGLLLGGVAGIPAPTVVVLGAGAAGQAAARLSAACGAHVIVLDSDILRLRDLHAALGARVTTSVASARNLARFTAIADVLIGAVLLPGAKSPFLISETMVKQMRPGSVIIDLSIDQGGCVETGRPTGLDSPVFKVHGVTHYCVPNMTAGIPRTASRALTIAALPYLTQLAQQGLDQALASSPGLARGVYMYRGKLVNEHLARALGETPVPLDTLLP